MMPSITDTGGPLLVVEVVEVSLVTAPSVEERRF